MKMKKLVASAMAGAALVGLIALPASAGTLSESHDLTVTKLVIGEGNGTFTFDVECYVPLTPGPDSLPPQALPDSLPATLANGESFTVSDWDLGTEFNYGVNCTVSETVEGDRPARVSAIVLSSDGEVITANEADPGAATFAFDFDTVANSDLDYTMLFVNDYSEGGTAAELCTTVESFGASALAALAELDTVTAEDLRIISKGTVDFLVAGLAVAPASIHDAWENVTMNFLTIDGILETVDYDPELLDASQVMTIASLLEDVAPDLTTIADFLVANCIPEPTTSTTASTTSTQGPATPKAVTPRFAG